MGRSDQDADPRTVADPAAEAVETERAFLVVYYDADRGPRGGHTEVVPVPDGAEVLFGRAPKCTVRIDSDRVSRQHTRVTRRGPGLVVEDLGSRNGTRVNGDRIEGPTRLASGDEIAVGPVTAVVGLTARLRRRAQIASASELDERLLAETDRAQRYRRALGLVMLRLDGGEDACEGAIDRVAGSIRRMDFLAEYGPDEFAVLLPEADRPATQEAAHRFAREARAAGLTHGVVSIHVGFAVLWEDGTQAGELLDRARGALRAARTGLGEGGIADAPPDVAVNGGGPIVADAKMKRVFALVDKVADTAVTVLLLGETGVGKEVVTAELHRRSARRAKPFIKVNCAAIPETLLESALFGHERGAFTGADRRRAGFFEDAGDGTLFLDEIGELPLPLQAKLLRVLEEKTFARVGDTRELPLTARVVCATNRDIEDDVARGRFRQDLYFRISAFPILVPPLRERRAEIRSLAEHFARMFARELKQTPPSFSPEAISLLEQYDWPGNVRELHNVVERAVVLVPAGVVRPEHIPDRVVHAAMAAAAPVPAPVAERVGMRDHLAEVERAALLQALAETGGNRTHAARRLGLSRRGFIYKLEKHGIKPPPR